MKKNIGRDGFCSVFSVSLRFSLMLVIYFPCDQLTTTSNTIYALTIIINEIGISNNTGEHKSRAHHITITIIIIICPPTWLFYYQNCTQTEKKQRNLAITNALVEKTRKKIPFQFNNN